MPHSNRRLLCSAARFLQGCAAGPKMRPAVQVSSKTPGLAQDSGEGAPRKRPPKGTCRKALPQGPRQGFFAVPQGRHKVPTCALSLPLRGLSRDEHKRGEWPKACRKAPRKVPRNAFMQGRKVPQGNKTNARRCVASPRLVLLSCDHPRLLVAAPRLVPMMPFGLRANSPQGLPQGR